MTILIER